MKRPAGHACKNYAIAFHTRATSFYISRAKIIYSKFVNGGRSAVILSVGKSAILCSPSLPLCRLQKVQLEMIFLAAALAWVIQYFFLQTESGMATLYMNMPQNQLGNMLVLG